MFGCCELAADARLLDEHVDVVLERAVLGLDVLDRDRALEAGGALLHRLVDGRHAALARDLHELVLAVDQLRSSAPRRPSIARLSRELCARLGATLELGHRLLPARGQLVELVLRRSGSRQQLVAARGVVVDGRDRRARPSAPSARPRARRCAPRAARPASRAGRASRCASGAPRPRGACAPCRPRAVASAAAGAACGLAARVAPRALARRPRPRCRRCAIEYMYSSSVPG